MEIISIDNMEREFGNGETTSMGKLENVSFFSVSSLFTKVVCMLDLGCSGKLENVCFFATFPTGASKRSYMSNL